MNLLFCIVVINMTSSEQSSRGAGIIRFIKKRETSSFVVRITNINVTGEIPVK